MKPMLECVCVACLGFQWSCNGAVKCTANIPSAFGMISRLAESTHTRTQKDSIPMAKY